VIAPLHLTGGQEDPTLEVYVGPFETKQSAPVRHFRYAQPIMGLAVSHLEDWRFALAIGELETVVAASQRPSCFLDLEGCGTASRDDLSFLLRLSLNPAGPHGQAHAR
jgi:hypothetical protein